MSSTAAAGAGVIGSLTESGPVARRLRTALLRWFALLILVVLASPAQAHPAPFSYLDLTINDSSVDGTLVVHMFDAAHELGMPDPERLLDPGVLAQSRARLLAVLSPRLVLRSGKALAIEWTTVTALPDRSAVRLAFRAPTNGSGALQIDARLFPYDPKHQTFVNVYEGGKLRQQWILSRADTRRTYYLGTTAGTLEVLRTFITAGAHHILIGPDHLLFLLALLLLGGSWPTLVRIVTAFTLGHSITLTLATLDVVSPPSSLVEPLIALTIVVVGVDNLLRGNGRDLRAWAALMFGLVHGFGFAAVLREFGLPREALGWSLFSFNVGVEIGQLAVVLVVASLLDLVRRRSATIGYRVAVAGSIVVIVAGSFWFVERVFFPGGV